MRVAPALPLALFCSRAAWSGISTGSYTSSLEEEWHGDELHFRVVAMMQTVSGRIHVMDDNVRVEVDLPWILTAIAETVRSQIEKRGSQILLGQK